MAAQCAPETQSHDDEAICDDCKAVDWSSLPSLAADGSLETTNLKLRSLRATAEELRESSCRICAILSTIYPFKRRAPKRCVLRALPLSRQRGYTAGIDSNNVSRCTVLSVSTKDDKREFCLKTLCLAALKLDDLGSRTVKPNSIDYNNLKDLVRNCEEKHKECCVNDSRRNVLDLKVINTTTCEVIRAPDQCRYLALSYVWGKQEGEGSTHDIQNSPPVVKDVISVTNSMGYSYLWVDRYVRHRGLRQI